MWKTYAGNERPAIDILAYSRYIKEYFSNTTACTVLGLVNYELNDVIVDSTVAIETLLILTCKMGKILRINAKNTNGVM